MWFYMALTKYAVLLSNGASEAFAARLAMSLAGRDARAFYQQAWKAFPGR
jgi:hypothetical protein